jgi:acetyl esterase
MPLDPQARAIIDLLASSDMPDLSIVEPEVIRKLTDAAVVPDQGEPVARVENRTLPGPAGEIPVRIYAPHTNGPLPVVAYFHGGGFVYCGLDTHDDTCRALANASGCSVVSVDYRLAPENKFPAAPEDAFAVTRWLADNGAEIGVDPQRIAVAGDSAGGNLATVVALMARDRGGPALAFQLLVYPVADFGFDTDSYRENADGYLLTEKMMRAFWNHYLGDEADGDHPYASPLRAECLDALPPAFVVTAEFDPLRDEGEAYAARLAEAGVPTTARRYDGMIHGFFSMGHAIDRARVAVADAGLVLRSALGS